MAVVGKAMSAAVTASSVADRSRRIFYISLIAIILAMVYIAGLLVFTSTQLHHATIVNQTLVQQDARLQHHVDVETNILNLIGAYALAPTPKEKAIIYQKLEKTLKQAGVIISSDTMPIKSASASACTNHLILEALVRAHSNS